ncbi:MAG: dephospho-CoA kinase [Candidatus Pacebacteria bacterium]|nr:dephospho-CoA kinase [Candidatus Paceibacterota bacterium]
MKKHIIGLTGEMGSGKSTVARYLTEKYGAVSHKFSTPLRDILDRLRLEQSRKNLGELSTILRKTYGEDLFAKVVSQEVSRDPHDVIVVDGVRRLGDIRSLHELPEFKLLYIKGSLESRYDRITKRTQNVDDKGKTFEIFQKEQEQEAEIEIHELEVHADIVIKNDGSIEELFGAIDKVMSE